MYISGEYLRGEENVDENDPVDQPMALVNDNFEEGN